uniref:Mitochondrial uncoupling protein 4 n=1 Tax=Timema poppense TaxID=170557 RepID=A0A7R9D9A2_TIMPO|nr:unnamed protein product [Timema poppensis]
MDLIKTRLQIQGELAAAQEGLSSAPHRGMVQTAAGVIKEEGFFKLWHGLTPAIYRNIVYSGTRIVIYQKVREYVLKPDPGGNYSIWKSAVNGMFSGVVAQFLANPADLVKIQMQMEGKRRLMGKPPRIASPLKAFQSIYGKAGIAGLWKGAVPNMQRAALVNLGDLAAYDSSKRFLLSKTGLQDNYITHIIASICAGFVAAITGTPADVVKARVMNQPVDDKGRGLVYKNTADCFIQSIRNEGFFALYKGFVPMWFRLAPWALTFWVTSEQIRLLLGAATF